MRLKLVAGLAALALGGTMPVGGGAWAAPVPSGDYHTRLRANDSPLGGRFTIYAYFLDSLDVAVELPAPGRLLVLNFRDANGKDSFLVPGDLVLEADRSRWSWGFHPVGDGPLGGLLDQEASRWALWWVPWESDSLTWSSFADLRLAYGLLDASFIPLDAEEAATVRASLPWAGIRATRIDPQRPTGVPHRWPDSSVWEEPPTVLSKVSPPYPRSAKLWDFEGTVYVAATVDPKGRVIDASVLQSTASHDLNVAALVAAMDWVFRPGKKHGVWVTGEIVIPMAFKMGTSR